MPMPAPKLAADFRPRVERLLAAVGRDVAGDAERKVVEQGTRFAELVAVWNERVDLTAARDPDELVDLLFADAAAILHEARGGLEGAGARATWLDVGSGMGAPGVALALLEPRIALTLVEPRVKRVAFLRTLIHELGRGDIAIERARSETLAGGSCDVAVSRATLPPADWLREGARLARGEVWVLLAREPEPEAEGWEIAKSYEYVWPLTGMMRRAVQYRRSSQPLASKNSVKIEK
jgi:16S rRNA (guanine527-N7)-methyltransferase